MRKIALNNGKYALVDNEDYELVMASGMKWRVSHAKNSHGYYVVRNRKNNLPRRGCVWMHEEILGKREGYEIDHINGDGLDNRKSNLRHLTHAQNIRNRTHTNRNSTTGVGGVSVNNKPYGKRYRAYCTWGGRQKHLGYFDEVIEAGNAVKEHQATCNGVH